MAIDAKTDMQYDKRNIIILIAIAVLHVFASMTISFYHGNLAGKQVGSNISRDIYESNFKDKDIKNMKDSFKAEVGPTYYFALALSLPFGRVFRPLHEKWIARPLLNHEIGQDEFIQRTRIVGGAQLVSNGIFFGLIILYIRKLVWRFKARLIKGKTA